MKPRIGISYSEEISVEPYAEAVRASGGEPVSIAPGDQLNTEELDGLLLAGGVDVNPGLYGETRGPETEAPNDARDALEQQLVTVAYRRRLPVLAICRGMQLLNVVSGGTLVQHMNGHEIRTQDKALPAHDVSVEPDSGLGEVLQATSVAVNSRHHQGVERVGEGLRVVARGPDGNVEAIENPAFPFVLGVQWHPENMAAGDPIQRRLFDRLVACSRPL